MRFDSKTSLPSIKICAFIIMLPCLCCCRQLLSVVVCCISVLQIYGLFFNGANNCTKKTRKKQKITAEALAGQVPRPGRGQLPRGCRGGGCICRSRCVRCGSVRGSTFLQADGWSAPLQCDRRVSQRLSLFLIPCPYALLPIVGETENQLDAVVCGIYHRRLIVLCKA